MCFSLINSLKPILLTFILRICDGSYVIKPLFFIGRCLHSPGPVIPENQFSPPVVVGRGRPDIEKATWGLSYMGLPMFNHLLFSKVVIP